MSEWQGGKGSKQRPVDKQKFDAEFDRIFGKKDQIFDKDKPKCAKDDKKA